MESYLLISDAAKEVKVESHVLRYWEEELHLPIKRNELGHRYYTREDVERFRQIKLMKEKGLQLKAIKMILKDGKLNVLSEGREASGYGAAVEEAEKGNQAVEQAVVEDKRQQPGGMNIDIVSSRELEVKPSVELMEETREEKAKRLQWLLRQLIKDALEENNQELCREIKENIVKELDYQFRSQEEREEERERARELRSEEYYKKMDEILRKKSRKELRSRKKQEEKPNKPLEYKREESAITEKKDKKKRHSIF